LEVIPAWGLSKFANPGSVQRDATYINVSPPHTHTQRRKTKREGGKSSCIHLVILNLHGCPFLAKALRCILEREIN
jgi:hypothetical protein